MQLHKNLELKAALFCLGVVVGLLITYLMSCLTAEQIISNLQCLLRWVMELPSGVIPLTYGGYTITKTGYMLHPTLNRNQVQEKLPIDQRGWYSFLAGTTLTLAVSILIIDSCQNALDWFFLASSSTFIIYLQTTFLKTIQDPKSDRSNKTSDISCKANCLMLIGIAAIFVGILRIILH